MKKYLQGIEHASPFLVGVARGALEASLLAGLGVIGANVDELVTFLPALPVPEEIIAPGALGIFLVRAAEGWVDRHIDPDQNRTASGTG